jgi:hypothetical protein
MSQEEKGKDLFDFLKIQESVRKYKALANEKRQLKSIADFKGSCQIFQSSYFLYLYKHITNSPDSILRYGDIPGYTSTLRGRYDYENLLKAFDDRVDIAQNAYGQDGVSILITSKDGSIISQDILDKARDYYVNLPHVKWLETFSKIDLDQEELVKVGESLKPSYEVVVEFSFLISILTGASLDDAFALLERALSQSKLPLELATTYKGITLYIKGDNEQLFPEIHLNKNKLTGNEMEPFFSESKTFASLVMGFTQAGLQLSNRLLSALLEETKEDGYKSRYGNGYADLVRKITEQLGESLYLITRTLFSGETPETAVVKVNNLPNLSTDSPAGLVFYLIKELYKANAKSNEAYILTTSSSIKDGSCKDAETYFLQAKPYQEQAGRHILYNSGDLLAKKEYGSRTALAIKPITVGGITFPPGYLFQVDTPESPKTIRPLRPTMASFTSELAEDAFGWQLEEVRSTTQVQKVTEKLQDLMVHS